MRIRIALLAALAAGLATFSFAETPPPDDGSAGMALVPAGPFAMGRTSTTSDDETGMRPLILRDDRPVHTVDLSAYYLDRTEVTHAEYAAFVDATGRKPPHHWVGGAVPEGKAAVPVYNVDWEDAGSYCQWQGKRLPTEAEWEKAARGGLEAKDFPWGDEAPGAKSALFNTSKGPGPAGQFPANAFGLHDMAGSMSEWCSDWFARTYYETSPAANPQGPDEGMYRIIRGGAWSDGPRRVTVFFRNWVRPNQKTPNIGFRCAKDARDTP